MRPPSLPLLDLKDTRPADLWRDLVAAAAVTLMAIPQGLAYALIAGLPPAMGLYAACVPTIVGALFRSSRHLVTGPTNALSLLVGGAVAANAGLDPVGTAALLALMIGGIQVLAGMLRLGVLVDYISIPVVTGYITGAAVLIAVGQLPNLIGADAVNGNLFVQLAAWVTALPDARLLAVLLGAGTLVGIIRLRRVDDRLPAPLVVLALATALAWALGAAGYGVRTVADVAPIPQGLPPLTLPPLTGIPALFAVALAGTVLSLVESSAVARNIATRSGQRLDLSSEFLGQGLANVAGAFFGGYPTSGSLSRSALNHRAGARTRMAGVFSGLLVLLTLLFLGPVVDHAPIAALAGVLVMVAVDLVDVEKIRTIVAGRPSDAAAFLGTLVGTWVLSLDQAIYLGVGISLVLFLRRARLLMIQEMGVDPDGHLREVAGNGVKLARCGAIRILQVEGQLFFGAAGELQDALEDAAEDPRVRVVLVRIKRTQGLDVTTAEVFRIVGHRLAMQGRHLILVGMRAQTMALLEKTHVVEELGQDHVFPTEAGWFVAMDRAVEHACDLVGAHDCGEGCPMAAIAPAAARTA